MLNLNDIVALAKSGYKVDDIKELIALSKEADKTPDDQGKPADQGTPEDNIGGGSPKDNIEGGTVAPDQKKTEDPDKKGEADEVIDYKKKAEELEQKLQELQKANTKQNMAAADDKKSDSEQFAEVMKSFM